MHLSCDCISLSFCLSLCLHHSRAQRYGFFACLSQSLCLSVFQASRNTLAETCSLSVSVSVSACSFSVSVAVSVSVSVSVAVSVSVPVSVPVSVSVSAMDADACFHRCR